MKGHSSSPNMLVLCLKVMPGPRILLAVKPLPTLLLPGPQPSSASIPHRELVVPSDVRLSGVAMRRNIRETRWAGAGLRLKPTLNLANKLARDTGGEGDSTLQKQVGWNSHWEAKHA